MGLAREPTGEGLRRWSRGALVEMVVTATTDGG